MNVLTGITDNKDILFVEAYLLLKNKGIRIDKIYAIKTKEGRVPEDIKLLFEKESVKYTIVDGREIGILRSEEDYNKLEEFFFDFYAGIKKDEGELYVFIGGGHKLHALALQRSAVLFGAGLVFHLFYDGERGTEPDTVKGVKTAIEAGKLLFASLGQERGWPALLNIKAVNSHDFRKKIINITTSITSRNVDDVNEFPFECLNLLPQMTINWLNQPLADEDLEWVAALPKTDLHCHLGGFATHGELLDQVRQNAKTDIGEKKDIRYPRGWPLPETNIPLEQYMKLGDNNGSYILHDEGCLEKQIELLYENFIDNNVRYAEVRCSPYNYATKRNSGKDILDFIVDSINRQMVKHEHKCHVNLLIIATRNKSSKYIERNLDLAVNYVDENQEPNACKVVGVDLAGYENIETRPGYFESDFEIVHRKGLDITIHAGENDEAEGIWEAIYKLNTRRIGHGLNLYQDKNLVRSVVNRKIGVEMCPYANYQIAGFIPMKGKKRKYPLLDYLNAGIQVCINTDNIGISDAGITDNFMLLTKLNPGITRMQILRLIRNGILQAFVQYKFRINMLRSFNKDIFDLLLNKNF